MRKYLFILGICLLPFLSRVVAQVAHRTLAKWPSVVAVDRAEKDIFLTRPEGTLRTVNESPGTVFAMALSNNPVTGRSLITGFDHLATNNQKIRAADFGTRTNAVGGAITAGEVTGNISACQGTPSASPNIQQVTVSGTGLSADIKGIAPPGFEISLNPGSGYTGSVVLTQSGGAVNGKTIYVRSAASAVGEIFGSLTLSSTGVANRNLLVNGIINAVVTADKPADQTKLNGQATDAVNFTGTAKYYTWTNDNPSIGLPANGSGDIASFTAINNTAIPVKARITVTPKPAGLAYIANYGTNNVSVINTATNKLITTIPVGSNPYTVTASKDGNRVYVVNTISNNVSVINTTTNAVIATIDVAANPLGAIINEDGSRLYVINKGNNSVSFINTISTEVIKTIPLNAVPYNVAISKDGSTLFVTNYEANTVSVVDIATETVTDIAVKAGPFGIVLSPDGSKVYITNELADRFSVIDVATKKVIASTAVGQTPYGIAISPDGSRIYVSCAVENKIQVINAATNVIIGSADVGDYPYGISVSDDGTQVYSVNVNSSDVTVVNTANNSVIKTMPVGHNPYSLGNFVAKNSGCSGTPVSFTITVKPTASPTITTSGTLTALSATYSNASSTSTSFTLSGTSLAAGILVTPPAGFEVSVDNVNFGTAITVGATGTISATTIYVRLAPVTNAGTYSGNILLTSPGATNVTVPTVLSTVSRAALTVRGLDLHKNYGTTIYGAANAFSFTADGLQNGEVVGSVTIAYGAGALASDPPAIYPASVTVKDATGGTFNPDNYVISYLPSDLTVDPPPTPSITINGTLQAVNTVYGMASGFTSFLVSGSQMQDGILITPPAGFEVSLDDVTYSNTVKFGVAGFIPQTPVYVRLNATAPVQTYTGNVIISSTGMADVMETIPNSTVTRAPLSIKPLTVYKAYGDNLSDGPDFTTFTSIGLQNSETIGSISVTYTSGAVAADAAGTYTNSIIPSQATGGTFNPDNYTITYLSGDLVVNGGPAIPVISFTNVTSSLNTTYGTPSPSTNFTISATDATKGIKVTPPAGFEVSFDDISFSKTVSIGSAGVLSRIPVYIRLSSTTDAGSYPGDVLLSTPVAQNKYVSLLNNTVIPATLTITAINVTKTYGDNLIGGPGATGFSSSALQNGETIGSVSLTYAAGSAAADHAGTYGGAVVSSMATGGTFKAGNYDIKYNTADVVVNNATLTITAVNSSRKYGEANPTLQFNYSGFKNGEDLPVLTTQPLVSTTATILSPIGLYAITVSGAAATNYNFIYVSGTLSVEPLSAIAIAIPNAFSPNGDGQNDTWDIKNIQNYPNNTVNVYNRYGERLFSSIGYDTAWDGRYNGINLPLGTYYYIINPKNGSNVISGYVTIIR